MSEVTRFTCEEVFARLDDYLDRELSDLEMRLVAEHLETCAICAAEHRFERHVLDDVKHKLRRIQLPPALVDRVRELIRAESR